MDIAAVLACACGALIVAELGACAFGEKHECQRCGMYFRDTVKTVSGEHYCLRCADYMINRGDL